jgi:hypothetical protein
LNEVKNLNSEVRKRLKKIQTRTVISNDKQSHETIDLKNTGYQFCNEESINALSFNQQLIDRFSQGALLPDFLVFLGPKLRVINPTDTNYLSKLEELSQSPLPMNSCVILDGKRIIIRKDALKGTLEIMLYVYDLLCLIPNNAELKYLNENEILDLLNWESEHYRQSQNKI